MIEKFKPDLEVEATVKFDGSVIEGASALWCAAGKKCRILENTADAKIQGWVETPNEK